MQHRSRNRVLRVLGAAAIVVPAVSLAGCSSTSVAAVFTGQTAYADTVAAQSAQVTIAAVIQTPSTRANSNVTGSIAWASHMGLLHDTTMTATGQTITVDAILDGSKFYVQIPAQAPAASGGKQWIETTTANSTGSSPFGISGDPAQALSVIRSVSSSVTTVGSETISGTPTTHYRATVDLTKAAAQNPSQASEDNKLTQELGASMIPTDLWVDAQHRLRRLHEVFTNKGLPPDSSPLDEPQLAPLFPTACRSP